jgi:hypothetical protein
MSGSARIEGRPGLQLSDQGPIVALPGPASIAPTEGYINKQMSELIVIDVKIVESHRAAAMRRLNLSSTAALVQCALPNKFVEP